MVHTQNEIGEWSRSLYESVDLNIYELDSRKEWVGRSLYESVDLNLDPVKAVLEVVKSLSVRERGFKLRDVARILLKNYVALCTRAWI